MKSGAMKLRAEVLSMIGIVGLVVIAIGSWMSRGEVELVYLEPETLKQPVDGDRRVIPIQVRNLTGTEAKIIGHDVC